MANALVARNADRADRALVPSAACPPGEVLIVQWPSMEEEAEGLASFIARRISAGATKAGNVLVLAPRRQFGYAIRDALVGAGVAAHSFFHEEALDVAAAQEAFTLLTLLARPTDRVALRSWCGFGSPSFRAGAWKRLRAHCEATGLSPRGALERLASGALTLQNFSAVVERFELLQRRLAEVGDVRGPSLADALFPASEAWAGPLRTLAAQLGDEFGAVELHESLLRSITQPELPTDVDFVRVMSLHKSKGLTADLVVVAGCVQGLIPTLPRDETSEQTARAMQEQRRLFYVAITRARKTLVLSSVTTLPSALAFSMGAAPGRRTRGRVETIASEFLAELGPARPTAITGANLDRHSGG